MKSTKSRLLELVIAAAVVSAACGSTGPSPSAPSSTTIASSAATDGPSGGSPGSDASSAAVSAPSLYASPGDTIAHLDVPQRTVFVQLFEWRWTDVATECEQWLGPRGFAAVQVSPAQEHALIDDGTNHFPWWQRYQAVSYRLESRSGTRAEFAEMVNRCRAMGVEVYADVLLNHMAAGQGTGSAGTKYTKYRYPGLYEPADFHANANPAFPKVLCDHGIQVTADPVEVQTCELSGLADLRTEEPAVQQKLAAYLADLYGLGVRGFRVDAAKHIPAVDLHAILSRLRATLPSDATFFVDQEVTDLGGDVIPAAAYYPTGSVDDFVFSAAVGDAFLRADQTIASLKDLSGRPDVAPADRGVTFVDNHDLQRGRIAPGLVLTYKRQALYALANAFVLAWPSGYPRLMSSYAFSDTEVGPPSDAAGRTNAVFAGGPNAPHCGTDPGQWVCEQRWHAIAGMVGFRDFTAGATTLTDWWANPDDGNQIAFGRGAAGFIAINRSAAPLTRTLTTSLPAGRYCDVFAGDLAADRGGCTGVTVTVAADGSAAFDVPPMQAVAIHVGARVS
jgi:alpha-amylase